MFIFAGLVLYEDGLDVSWISASTAESRDTRPDATARSVGAASVRGDGCQRLTVMSTEHYRHRDVFGSVSIRKYVL